MIFFHELGHFLAAKYFNVKVLKFALGFGPKITARDWGETEYSIRYFPLGGFVKMLGEDEIDEESEEIAPEDEGCARYIAHLLGSGTYNHLQSLREIVFHESTQKFLRGDTSYFPPEDPILCLQRDIYDFVLRVKQTSDFVRVEKIVF